jgi:hypothetical protein
MPGPDDEMIARQIEAEKAGEDEGGEVYTSDEAFLDSLRPSAPDDEAQPGVTPHRWDEAGAEVDPDEGDGP